VNPVIANQLKPVHNITVDEAKHFNKVFEVSTTFKLLERSTVLLVVRHERADSTTWLSPVAARELASLLEIAADAAEAGLLMEPREETNAPVPDSGTR
jgi:hypothetical protein